MTAPRKPRKTIDERLREVYAKEEAVEAATKALQLRADRLREKAEALAGSADAVMAAAEQDIEKRAAEANQKAADAAAPRFTEAHAEVASRLALGLPAHEGSPRPTSREVAAALALLATLDQKAREREERLRGGDVVIRIVNPFADDEGAAHVEVHAERARIDSQAPDKEDA